MIHPTALTALVAEEQAVSRRRSAGEHRIRRSLRRRKTPTELDTQPSEGNTMLRSTRAADRASGRYDTVAVRAARPEDQEAIRRIALLDDKPVPHGPLLIAEADGEVIAALGKGGCAVAHPFRWTRDVVTLLEMRSVQLRASHV